MKDDGAAMPKEAIAEYEMATSFSSLPFFAAHFHSST